MVKRALPDSIDGVLDESTNLDFKYLRDLLYFSVVRDFRTVSNAGPAELLGKTIERMGNHIANMRIYVCDDVTGKNTWEKHLESHPRLSTVDELITLITTFATYVPFSKQIADEMKRDIVGFAIMWPHITNIWVVDSKYASDFLAPKGLKLVSGDFEERDVTSHCSLETEVILPAEHNLWRHTRKGEDYLAAPAQVPVGAYRMDYRDRCLPQKIA